MASEGYLGPSSVISDDQIGDGPWSDPSNIIGEFDETSTPADYGQDEHSVRLVVDNVMAGNDKSTGAALPFTATDLSYGSDSDTWGISLTAAQVNASGFGLAVATSGDSGSFISEYLRCTNFGFAIPNGATIDGVVAVVNIVSSGGDLDATVAYVRLTVYYTEVPDDGVSGGVKSAVSVGIGCRF